MRIFDRVCEEGNCFKNLTFCVQILFFLYRYRYLSPIFPSLRYISFPLSVYHLYLPALKIVSVFTDNPPYYSSTTVLLLLYNCVIIVIQSCYGCYTTVLLLLYDRVIIVIQPCIIVGKLIIIGTHSPHNLSRDHYLSGDNLTSIWHVTNRITTRLWLQKNCLTDCDVTLLYYFNKKILSWRLHILLQNRTTGNTDKFCVTCSTIKPFIILINQLC